MMLLRERASQSLDTSAASLFCGTEMLAAPRPAERVQLEREDGSSPDLRSRQVQDGMPLNNGKVPVGPGTALVS